MKPQDRYMRTIEARLEQLANKKGNTIGEQAEQTGEQAREQENKVCSPVRTNSVKKPGKPHSMRGTNSREKKNLRRSIAMYKQRLVEGTLTEKGAATLARMEAQLKAMKA